jgi:hypothetical protein
MRAGVEDELLKDVVDMALHGSAVDEQLLADHLVAAADRHQTCDLPLPLGQRRDLAAEPEVGRMA